MNLEKYNGIFAEVFDVDESMLNDEFNFGKAPGWDSLAHMELIAKLEDAFDIMFESQDILHFGGYANGKKILARYGVEM